MNIDIEVIVTLILLLVFFDSIAAFRLIISKLKREDKEEVYEKSKEKLIDRWITHRKIKKIRPFFNVFSEARYIVNVDDETAENISERLADDRKIKNSFNSIKSSSKLRRIEAAVKLSMLGTKDAAEAIEDALLIEKKLNAKLYMANALADIQHPDSIPVLICSLMGEKKWYREKVNMMISEYGDVVHEYIPALVKIDRLETLDLLVDLAYASPTETLKSFIFDQIDYFEDNRSSLAESVDTYLLSESKGQFVWNRKTDILKENDVCDIHMIKMDEECIRNKPILSPHTMVKEFERIIIKAADMAVKYFFTDFSSEKYINHANLNIRRKSISSLAKVHSGESIVRLASMLSDEEVAKDAQTALSEMISTNPEFIDDVAALMINEKQEGIKKHLATSLSGKIEYFIMKVTTPEEDFAAKVIGQILLLGRTSEFIGFMNHNTNLEIENGLVKILQDTLHKDDSIKTEFCIYLNERILNKVGLHSKDRPTLGKKYDIKPDLIKAMYVIMIFILLLFPLIYVARHYEQFGQWPFLKHIRTYILDFNYILVFYSAIINLSYLALILLSRINISRQVRIEKMKNDKMLFRRRMLPGISIIAPAYNEESIIIESANSLLNLKYPDYNLIIVNDGSTDNTLKKLIDYYELDRYDYTYKHELEVAPIRGVYSNPAYPKLIVVDTENAGKADSLNSGIIISDKDYICCIDADSLLEHDALLKLASQTLDEDVETPALGGNVFPLNGCTVSRGHISNKRVPRKLLAKFQAVEYIRAFMSGRMGWSYINCLLIISGAFGLFRRERVIDVGGFLTQKSKYHKDTVGEDMELVVRIARLMHEKKKKFRINYCFNATCWTEVPEKWVDFRRQRVRWYTGLVETLHFHKKTIFNPKYGLMGSLGMPYYFLFEMVGPLIEVQGYLMVILALIFGVLSTQVALLLFLASVMLGTLVSIISILIAESKYSFYDYDDILRLIGIAVIENFGPRQFFSFWRVRAYLKMLFKKNYIWGDHDRRGYE